VPAGGTDPGGIILEKFNRFSTLGTFGLENIIASPISRILSGTFHVFPPFFVAAGL
jgi:hypothetical protein